MAAAPSLSLLFLATKPLATACTRAALACLAPRVQKKQARSGGNNHHFCQKTFTLLLSASPLSTGAPKKRARLALSSFSKTRGFRAFRVRDVSSSRIHVPVKSCTMFPSSAAQVPTRRLGPAQPLTQAIRQALPHADKHKHTHTHTMRADKTPTRAQQTHRSAGSLPLRSFDVGRERPITQTGDCLLDRKAHFWFLGFRRQPAAPMDCSLVYLFHLWCHPLCLQPRQAACIFTAETPFRFTSARASRLLAAACRAMAVRRTARNLTQPASQPASPRKFPGIARG